MGIKSKSLDLFDRPKRKRHLPRFLSLSLMTSIPEDSCCSTWAPVSPQDDDMVVRHRTPVSFCNGYRVVGSDVNASSKPKMQETGNHRQQDDRISVNTVKTF